ncbi:MAG: tetratricopeptide repeat protein, partial [Alphaproteobacteria bacterium]
SVALKPDDAGMVSNLGNAQRAVGNLQAALEVHKRAIALDPERGQSHYNSAIVTRDVGNFEAAQAGFGKAIELGYAPAQLFWDRALCHLMAGELETGFADYHYRWRLPESPPLHTDIADWDGDDLKGRSLLVYAEQGLGDSIQFIRYLPLLQAKGGRIVLEIQPELKRLVAVSAVGENVEIIERDKKLPPVDLKVPLLTLPHIFKANLGN